MALVLETLAQRAEPLSERLRELPRYHSAKLKLALSREAALVAALEQAFPDGSVDRVDGLRLRFADGAWLGLRRSNTEPIVRLVVESADAQWVSRVVSMLQKV